MKKAGPMMMMVIAFSRYLMSDGNIKIAHLFLIRIDCTCANIPVSGGRTVIGTHSGTTTVC